MKYVTAALLLVGSLRYTATYMRGGALGWRMVALHIGPAPER